MALRGAAPALLLALAALQVGGGGGQCCRLLADMSGALRREGGGGGGGGGGAWGRRLWLPASQLQARTTITLHPDRTVLEVQGFPADLVIGFRGDSPINSLVVSGKALPGEEVPIEGSTFLRDLQLLEDGSHPPGHVVVPAPARALLARLAVVSRTRSGACCHLQPQLPAAREAAAPLLQRLISQLAARHASAEVVLLNSRLVQDPLTDCEKLVWAESPPQTPVFIRPRPPCSVVPAWLAPQHQPQPQWLAPPPPRPVQLRDCGPAYCRNVFAIIKETMSPSVAVREPPPNGSPDNPRAQDPPARAPPAVSLHHRARGSYLTLVGSSFINDSTINNVWLKRGQQPPTRASPPYSTVAGNTFVKDSTINNVWKARQQEPPTRASPAVQSPSSIHRRATRSYVTIEDNIFINNATINNDWQDRSSQSGSRDNNRETAVKTHISLPYGLYNEKWTSSGLPNTGNNCPCQGSHNDGRNSPPGGGQNLPGKQYLPLPFGSYQLEGIPPAPPNSANCPCRGQVRSTYKTLPPSHVTVANRPIADPQMPPRRPFQLMNNKPDQQGSTRTWRPGGLNSGNNNPTHDSQSKGSERYFDEEEDHTGKRPLPPPYGTYKLLEIPPRQPHSGKIHPSYGSQNEGRERNQSGELPISPTHGSHNKNRTSSGHPNSGKNLPSDGLINEWENSPPGKGGKESKKQQLPLPFGSYKEEGATPASPNSANNCPCRGSHYDGKSEKQTWNVKIPLPYGSYNEKLTSSGLPNTGNNCPCQGSHNDGWNSPPEKEKIKPGKEHLPLPSESHKVEGIPPAPKNSTNNCPCRGSHYDGSKSPPGVKVPPPYGSYNEKWTSSGLPNTGNNCPCQ